MSFSPRQSPFKRPESPVATKTPSTVPAASPHTSPTKSASSGSPMVGAERQSPFGRRPSQLGVNDRAKSPFARAPSRLSVAETPEPDSTSGQDPFVVRSQPLTSTTTSRASPLDNRPGPSMVGTGSPRQVASDSKTNTPAQQRTYASNATSNTKPVAQSNSPAMSYQSTAKPSLAAFANAGNYTHIPPALLRFMRESFEVLDTTSSNTVTKADLTSILEQLGLDSSPSSVAAFFPASGSQSLNLARFLDLLCEPMKDLSDKDELMAAFSAFDVDDSGQIDVAELRDAVLRTAPEGGSGSRLSEREVDSILREFTSRRAFGAKGVSGKDVTARGDVFKYRDFMANIKGSGQNGDGVAA